MTGFFEILICYKSHFQFFLLSVCLYSCGILYLAIAVGPQIWTEPNLFYKNLTIQIQKFKILKMLCAVCESDLCMLDYQDFYDELASLPFKADGLRHDNIGSH